MLSRETINDFLDAAEADLKKMSYEELGKFAEFHDCFDRWKTIAMEHNGASFDVNVLAFRGGIFRRTKRITIELNLESIGREIPEKRQDCRYFERYQSGRIWPRQ